MSPMSPRLLRPRATGFNPDAQDWVNRVYAAGSTVSQPVANAVSSFVNGCQADGIWDAMKSVVLMAGADTLEGALAPLKGTAPTAYNSANAMYSKTSGLKGDGSAFYLDTNRNNNADPEDSFHMALYKTVSSTGTAVYMGAGSTTTETGTSNMGRSGSSIFGRNRCSSGISTVALNTGFIGNNRSSSASFTLRSGGSSSSFSLSSEARHNASICVFSTTGGNFKSDGRASFYSIGEAVDLALLDARVSALMTAIGVS
jgi:hypothetical protein